MKKNYFFIILLVLSSLYSFGQSATTTKTDVLCFGGATGAIDLTVASGTPPYTFAWSNGSTTEDLSGLIAGTYSVVINDANGIIPTTALTIKQPAAAVSISSTTKTFYNGTDLSCATAADGQITVTASGGTGTLEYSKDNGITFQASFVFPGLVVGTYQMVARDANLCVSAPTVVAIAAPAPVTISSISSNAPVCSAATLNLFSVASGGTGILSYNWTGPNGFTATGPNPSLTAATIAASGTYTLTVTDANGCVDTATVAVVVNPSLTPDVTISLPTANTICAGTSVTFTANPINGGSSPTYKWQINGLNVPGATSSSFTTSALTNGQVVTVVMTSNATCATAGPVTSPGVTMNVNPNLAASVSISASATTICDGTTVTFTATPTNGGTTPAYQWYVGATPVGGDSPSYTTTTLANGQVVTAVLTSNATCATGNPATSNAIPINVNPNLPVSVSIAASASTICAGTSVTFTATPTNGGTTPAYQWYVGATPVGGSGATYTTTTLTDNQVVTAVLTSNANCATGSPATSNPITMVVNTNLPVNVSISASATTICAGTSVTFTATPTNEGTTPVYQWYVGATTVGSNSDTYTTTTLTQGQVVTARLTSNATCPSGSPATSNAITMTVNPILTASVGISASASTICAGTSVTFTATPTNGGATPVYQWYEGATLVGGNSATYTTTTLTDGAVVTAVLTSNANCISGSPATSNAITMDVNPILPVSVVIAASASTICAGTSVTFTATPTNAGTTPVYQWYVGATPVGGNSATYTTTTLANKQVVIARLTSNANCISGSPATSNAITMTVNPTLPVSVSIAASATTICAGTSVTFTATPTNGGTTPAYQWYVGATAVGSNSATYTTSALTTGQIVSARLTSNATCATGSPTTSNSITMLVNPLTTPSVSITSTSTAICSATGTPVTFTATPTNGGAAPVYQWKNGSTTVGTNSPTYTTTSLASGSVISVIMTSNATCTSPATATSNPITMTVYTGVPATPGPITPSNAISICPVATGYVFTVPSVANTTNYVWTLPAGWVITSGNGTTAITVDITGAAPTGNNQYVTVKAQNPCGLSAGSGSSGKISVDKFAAVDAGPDLSVCAGGTITLAGTLLGAAGSGTWSATTGSFLPNATTLNATYTPSITSGSVTLLFTPNTPGGSCSGGVTTDQMIVTVNPRPTSVLSGTQAICNGNAATLSLAVTGTGTISGTLSNGTAFSGTAPTITVNVSPSTTTTYTVATLTNGTCTAIAADKTSTATVTVNSRPTAAISGTTTLCNGATATVSLAVTGSGTLSGTLSDGTVFSGTAPTITVPVTPTTTTTYTVATLTNGTCNALAADKTGSATVTVNPRPTAAISGTTVLCNGSAAALSLAVTGSGTLSGTLSDGTAFSGTAPTITLNVSPTNTTTYTIATLANGSCTAIAADKTGSATVTVNPRPTAAVSGTQTICNGNAATLSLAVTGAGTISGTLSNGTAFSGTAPTITVNVSPGTTTTYTVATLTNGTCNAIAVDKTGSATVTVNPRPTATISGTQAICNGASATVSLAVTGSGTLSGTLSDGTVFSGTAPTITVPVTPTTTTTYTVATLTNGTCNGIAADKTGSATVTVNPRPTAAISGTPAICNGGTATLSLAVTGSGTLSGTLSDGTAFSGTAPTITVNLSPTITTSYTISTLTNGTCVAAAADKTGSATVTVNPRPTAILSGTQAICNGSAATLSLAVTGTGTISGTLSNGTAFSGTAPTITVNVSPSTTASYTIATLSNGSCPSIAADKSGSATVTVHQPVAITAQPAPLQTVCSGFPVSFSVTATGTGLTYEWFKNGISTGITSASFTISQAVVANAGTYTVVVRGTAPCANLTSANAVLNVNQDIDITSQPTAQVTCEGNNTSFSVATTGTVSSYVWRKGGFPVANGGNISGATTDTLTFTGLLVSNAGTYDVVISSPGGTCDQTISNPVLLTVNSKSTNPTAATATASTICNGGSSLLNLVGGGGGTGEVIKWYTGSCGGPLAGTGNNLSVSPTTTTTYYGRYEDAAPCSYNSNCATVTVTVNQKSASPTAATATATTICNGQSTALSLVGGGGGTGEVIKWYSGSCGGTVEGTGNSFSVSPTVTTTYYGRYEDGTPCSFNTACASITINVNQKSANPTSATATVLTICNGQSTALSLVGGGGGTGETIQWYSGSCGGLLVGTGNNLSVNPTTTTIYYGRYEDGTPCSYNSNCATVTVTVNQKSVNPTAATATLPTICNGQNTVLSLVGGGGGTGETIQWYSGSCGGLLVGTGNNVSVSPTTTTTYYGRYEDGTPCSYNSNCATVTVTVNQKSVNPNAATATLPTICNGQSTTLSLFGGGGGTGEVIKWYTASCGGTQVGTGNSLSVSPTTTTTYYGRYEDAAPCSYPSSCATVTVTVNQKSADPTSATATLTTICNGQSTALSLVGGGGGAGEVIQWYTASCGGTPVGTGNNLSVSPTTTTTYYGRYEDAAPCSYASSCATVTVTVNQKSAAPTAATATLTTICNGQSTALSLVGGGGAAGEVIKWHSGSCVGPVVGTGNGFSVSPVVTTTYYGRYENAAPCNFATACVSITINVNQKSANPTAATATAPLICSGQSTALSLVGGGGGAGETIKWYSGSCGGTLVGTGNGFSVIPLATTTYYGRYENAAPCGYSSSCATVTVTVDVAPVGGAVAFSSGAKTFTDCHSANGTVTLSGSTGTIDKWQTSTDGGYTWSDKGNAGLASYTYTAVTTATLFRAAVKSGSCTTVYSESAILFIIPNIKPTPVSALPSTICEGESTTLISMTSFSSSQALANGGLFNTAQPEGWYVDGGNFNASGDNGKNHTFSETNGNAGDEYNSVDKKFAIVRGNLNSIMETPIFDLIGLTTAYLTFDTAYKLGGGAWGKIDLSFDGGLTYPTNLANYNQNMGPYNAFNTAISLNLNAYLGYNNLRIRFSYHGTQDRNLPVMGTSWALDNIQIPQAPVPAITSDWKDLGTGAIISIANATNVTVTPPVTTTYEVTSYLNGCRSYGLEGTTRVTVTVNKRPTANIGVDQTICYDGTATFTIALTGQAPWMITYSNGITPTTVTYNGASPYVFTVTNIKANCTYTVTNLSDANCTVALPLGLTGAATVTVLTGTPGVWTGLVSTDWFDCKNWEQGLPSLTIDAQIPTVPSGDPRMPVIDRTSPFAAIYSGIATARDLIVATNASVTMVNTNNSELQISRDWRNSGAFIPGTGTVTFNGYTADQIQNINLNIKTKEGYYNLTTNTSGGAKGISVVDGFELTVANEVSLLSGDLRLTGEAQLVQAGTATNPTGGTGALLRDQQGQKNSFNYNYWSSPVSPNGINYSVGNVLRDGTDTTNSISLANFNQETIAFGDGAFYADGTLTNPIKVSNRWIWSYNSLTPASNTDWQNYFQWNYIANTGVIKIGEGFTMKGTDGTAVPTALQNYVFVGKPNSGTFSLNIAVNQTYLIGNPYPSALNADEFIRDNLKDCPGGRATANMFSGALYFWDHFGQTSNHYLADYVGGYGTYTLMGGLKAVANVALTANTGASGTKIAQRYIPVGQAFFIDTVLNPVLDGTVTTIANGTLTFKNSQRAFVRESSGNSIFMKQSLFKKQQVTSMDPRAKIRLSLVSATGTNRQLLVGADINTTNKFDIGYDAPMLEVPGDNIYWEFSNSQFVIQGVPNFDESQIIPLGITIANEGLSTIKIDTLENFPNTTRIYLYDDLTSKYHNIRESDFKISLPIGEYNNRFSLRFADKTLKVDDFTLAENILIYFTNNTKTLNIMNNFIDGTVNKVFLFNLLGQSITNWDVEDQKQNNIQIPIKNVPSGVYIVKVKTTKGLFSKKIVIR
jgi:hypothetical protein